jgi:hypothetical protein
MPRGDDPREKDIQMNRLIRLGVAAALVMGGTSAVLAQETGSVPAGEDSLSSIITMLPTATAPDLTAFTDTSTVNCVKVSTLPEDATNTAAALDTAITANQTQLGTLHSGIQANAAFITKVQESCAVAEFDPTKILGVQAEADGSYKVWLDDRAMAGGAMGTDAGATTTTPAPASGG